MLPTVYCNLTVNLKARYWPTVDQLWVMWTEYRPMYQPPSCTWLTGASTHYYTAAGRAFPCLQEDLRWVKVRCALVLALTMSSTRPLAGFYYSRTQNFLHERKCSYYSSRLIFLPLQFSVLLSCLITKRGKAKWE